MIKKGDITNRYILYYEGEVDETVLVFFIKKISDTRLLPNRAKSNIKFILIELITNIISHYSSSSYGIISLEDNEGQVIITCGNYVSDANLKRIESNLDVVKRIKNVKDHYNEQLKSVSYDKSVNLGLIEIYNRCKGNLKLNSKQTGKNLFVTFKIKLDDIN
ncbi:MAG: hypothetical protein JNK50_13465 [Bacteroidia bacterium]|nr:hypothetical protein [Bacteroidia bacterium]